MYSNPIRIKRRPKGILIPVEEYSPKPVYENEKSIYFGASNGQWRMQKYLKKSCVYCGGAVSFVGIIQGKDHKVVERYCEEHANTHGPLHL